jgi:uncharacterized protein
MKVIAFRLSPGSDLRNEIQRKASENKISAGWILTCVGSLRKANLRYANQNKHSALEGFFEIVSLTGTVSVNGSHLHISISDEHGVTIGGHLLEGNIIYTTAEIVIGYDEEIRFTREIDSATGWRELVVAGVSKE